ncbi:MAG: hypothetical protein OWQ59_11260 [Alicyclobacillaceae bacterium]|jgi:hypothetical protein|uniref:hypothetical protein n=1 Tax=Alicyclobacillus sp. SP_1 TaxID=2942475 RepID=UPI0021573504|nr:hypothetical protein [Alicyclobacillus sp. SP_1]MCY0889019.1 hypothetical protein [Alicyclobacillaceae bacterium]MCY0896730.1 hypothetical protein [Alicyclobacillaceae bacterium]
MAWVYVLKLMDSRFQASCLAARLEDGYPYAVVPVKPPRYVGVFRTQRGRYGVKILW